MESPYLPIDINTFRHDSVKAFDVFFESGEGKKVLYCARGEVVSEETRRKLNAKHIAYNLYILNKDKVYYERYIELVLKDILADPQLSIPVKTKIAYDAIKGIMESLFESPKSQIIRRCKKALIDTVEFVIKDNAAFQSLISLTSFDYNVYNHSINVGILATGLTLELIKSDPDLNYQEMVVGFFLHDIGKCSIPVYILNKKNQLSKADWSIIKRHPEEGCKILKECGALTKEANIIVSQHHERHNGTGYPKELMGKDIHLFAKVCSIADVFDGLTSNRPYRKEHSTYNALSIMKNEMYRDLDPKLFAMFVKLFVK